MSGPFEAPEREHTEQVQGPGPRARRRSVAVGRDNRGVVSTGDNARITPVRLSMPVFGPLIATAGAHPVAAGIVAVVVVSGAAVGGATLSGSGGGPSTEVQRQVVLQASTPEKPVGYDFSGVQPTLSTGQSPAIYYEYPTFMASNGRIGLLSGGVIPTRASDCGPAFASGAPGGNRPYADQVGNVICYVDGSGRTGYLLITGYTETTLTIDTAHLPAG